LTPDAFSAIVPKTFIPIVVAECGKPLRWVDWSEYYTFCWRDAKPHMATPDAFSPSNFPDGYCYVASEWSVEEGGRVILLEMHRRDVSMSHDETCGDESPAEIQTPRDLSPLDRDFHLGLYRYAVQRYQPIVEGRTGVQLGAITVKDISELYADKVAEIERWFGRGWRGFLRRLRFQRHAESWRASAEDSISRIDPRTGAVYGRNAIYVSFTLGTMYHEDAVARTTVHELTHCLWERLGGQFLRPSRRADSQIQDHKLAVEGYAVYAERIWFRDSYPLWLRRRLASERLDESTVYIMGMRAIEKLVDKWGEWILLKVPRDWQKLLKTIRS
jgi:hypothetical protein